MEGQISNILALERAYLNLDSEAGQGKLRRVKRGLLLSVRAYQPTVRSDRRLQGCRYTRYAYVFTGEPI